MKLNTPVVALLAATTFNLSELNAGSLPGKNPVYKVSGSVVDEKKESAPMVNVFLLKAKDSTIVTGVAADVQGKYLFEQVPAGDYLAMASMVGYKKSYSARFTVKNADIALPVLALDPDIQALKEVSVVAKKPFITQEIDRTVINVEGSIVSAGSTALEVLERSPGVTVDQQNDKLQLRGKEGVIVQIDGKQTYLSQSELVTLLRNTPSDNIEKIELITNPSAKYDAAGNSGIINIKFKKNKNFGTNGNVSIGAGIAQRNKARGNGSVSLNHREGKISLFGTGSAFVGEGFNEQKINRSIPYQGKTTYFDMLSESDWTAKNYSARVGMDYFATDKTTIGVLFSGFYNKWRNPLRATDATIRNNERELEQTYRTEMEAFQKLDNITTNVNLKHKFDDKGKELTFDVDYVKYNGKGYNGLDTRYYTPTGEPSGTPAEIVRNNMPSNINIGVAKLDYTQTVAKSKLEMGLKSSIVASDNNMMFDIQNDGSWIPDATRTNQFKYTENINAAYTNLSGAFNSKTKYQFGLRLEHTHAKGNSVTLNRINDRNYVNLFPSIFISRTLDSSNTLNLSYSRRIDRPNYQSLNPFEYYLDPYTFSRGNPDLKPQFTHSVQLTHVFKSFVNTTLAYSRVSDMIAGEVPMLVPEENKTYVMSQNLDKQNYVSLTIGAPIPVAKWWNIQTNLSGSYNRFMTYYRNAQYDMKIYSMNAYVNSQFTLPNNWSAEISGWYNSPTIYGLFSSRSQGAVNLGLQKSVLQKKATLRLNVQDVFASNRFRGKTQFEDIDVNIQSRWPSRQIRFSISYRFGNQNVKAARQRGTGADELQQRAGNGNG